MISGGYKVGSVLQAVKQFEASPQGFRNISKAVVDAGLDFLRPLVMELQKVIKPQSNRFVGTSRFGKAPPKISSSQRDELFAEFVKRAWASNDPQKKEVAALAFAEWFNHEIVPMGVHGRDIHGKV